MKRFLLAAGLLVSLHAPASAGITDGLVAYWSFDETNGMVLNDATTNASHGTLVNFPADNSQWVAGRIGGALNFRGAANGDYVRVPNYPKPRTSMTICAWVWADARPQWATIAKNWPTPGTAQFHFGLQDTGGDLSNYLIQQGGTQLGPVQEGAALPLAAWQHVALVCDGSAMRLYRNGAQVGAPLAYNGTINTNCQASLGIGVKLASGSVPPAGTDAGYWQGRIDDLGLWNRALSAGEILSIYGAGLEGRSLTNAESSFGGGVVAITEFMASNTGFLRDSDGDSPDWIEIYNGNAAPLNLAGWSLTDNPASLRKWLFPATNLAANSFMIVFASGKDRAVAGAELHTSFQLTASGEYLALVDPRTNIVSEFAPVFPPQVANVSYGVARLAPPQNFITNGSPLRYQVITDDALGTNWIFPAFNDAAWPVGTNFVGYETAPEDYAGLYKTDVRTLMFNRSPSCLIRLPFVVSNATDWTEWKLRLQADDGVVIWLNGEEIIRYYVPDTVLWNTFSTTNRVDTEVLVGEVFQLTEFENLIVSGTNLLAIHALNARLDSSDLLIAPVLEAKSAMQVAAAPRYFTVPTPGAANVGGTEGPGPILSDLAHAPAVPVDSDNLLVTVGARPAPGAITNVTLHYRVMYSNEVATPMLDDGAHGDGAAGDGVFGATIPAGASQPGQMVRYYVTALDDNGRAARWPLFLDPFGSAEYQGTMVRTNPATALPVLHWFVQNTAAAETFTGTRCSLFFNDEFYDNVFVRIRGQTSRNWPKKSYKFDLNEEHHFLFRRDASRVGEINVNGTYTDKSYVRYQMADEHKRDAGLPCMESFHLRLHQNGQFYSVALFVEQVDRDFLRRQGLPDTGALYKGNQSSYAVNTSLYEKHNRKTEDFSDLQAFFNGLQLSGAALENFLFDNVVVADAVNYMATVAITQDIDATDKNHFFYRDTEGTRMWKILPWDIDLTFGPNALNTDTIVYNQQDTNTPACASHPFIGARPYTLSAGKYNRLLEVIVQTPRSRAMLLRRIRTLADQYLATGYFTNRINVLVPLLQPDVDADYARWGANAHFGGTTYTLRQANDRVITEYLTPRLPFLTGTAIGGVGTANPGSQPPLVSIQFAGVEVNPPSGIQDQEFLCLTNANLFPVDMTGWKLRGDVEFEFDPGTVLLPASVLYVSPNLVEFRARPTSPRGGQGLFAEGNYRGHLSARGGSVQLLNEYSRPIATLGTPAAPSPAQQFLRVTELMYHPVLGVPALAGTTFEDYEFIELRNTSPVETLDLAGVRFLEGIQFDFNIAAVTTLAPGARVLIVANQTAFTNRYGNGLPIAGQYAGELDNGGERLHLVDARGEDILDFTYDNHWYPATDGHGFSLVIVDDTAPWTAWGLAAGWRASGTLSGSPGAGDPAPPAIAPIRVNEALSTSVPAGNDTIELFNPATTNVDVGGWWLSDAFNTPKQFRIPDGTVLPPGGFAVFTEADFNPGGAGFSLDPDGDDVWLFSAGAGGELSGYAHGFSFGAAEPGVSFGRHVLGTGEEQIVAQSTNTPATNNAPPRVGPVVISEIMFRPPDLTPHATVGPAYLDPDNTRDEFIELQNITATNVPLADWRLRDAVDFDFPSNATLAAGARLLVVGFDPIGDANALAAFRAAYGLPANVALLGPWNGKLDNSGEDVELRMPSQYGTNFSHPLVEQVHYHDSAPWPGADGNGASLQRRVATQFANDPANWTAATPTPGAASPGGSAPTLLAQPADTNVLAYSSASLSVTADGTTPLRYQWRRNGASIANATNATLTMASVQPQQYGRYSVVVFNSAGSVSTTGALMNVYISVVISQQPQGATVSVGTNVTFTVGATGTGQLRYQWRKDGVNRTAATNATLMLTNVQLTDAGAYTVVITDDIGSIPSQAALLSVLSPPTVTMQASPAYQEVPAGGTIQINVGVAGTAPLSFKWRRNNITVLNQTNVTLLLTNAQTANAGNYTLLITNLVGIATSAPPAVVVVLADTDHDGMPDQWMTQYFVHATAQAGDLSRPGDDFDGDGMSNLAEYIAGTDPTNILSYFKIESIAKAGPVTMTFYAVSNRTYSVLYTDTLGIGAWSKLGDIPAQLTNRVATIADPAVVTNRTYRLVTPRQP